MFAQVLDGYGDVDVLNYRDIDTPQRGPGQVRVQVAYAALNPVEWKIRSGALAQMLPQTFPLVLGNEMSGVIDQAEPDSGFQVGDRVTGFTRAGSDAHYVLTTPDRIAKIPDGLSLRHAATIPQGVETARRALGMLDINPGDTVIVNGAAGSVGSAAVQILHDRDVTVIGTAQADNHDYLHTLGAIPVTYGEGLLDRLHDLAPHGVDAALDCGAGGFVEQILHVLPAENVVTVSEFAALALGVRLANGDPLALLADSFQSILPAAAEDRFITQIAAEYPLTQLAAAHTLSQAGHLRGKILINIADLDA